MVKDCDYGDQSDNQVRDQVVQRCKSHALRRKLLEKGENLTLALFRTTAATHEAVQSQLTRMEGGEHTMNLIRDSSREVQQRKEKEPSKGYRCGTVGHFGRDPNCPARGKVCKKYGGTNHFPSILKRSHRNLPSPVKSKEEI